MKKYLRDQFEELSYINPEALDISAPADMTLGWRPFVPSKNNGSMLLQTSIIPGTTDGFAHPVWFSGWRDETLSWHLTCSLSCLLNPSPITIIKGPDAKKFMEENFVNNIDNFPIGLIKHGILCLEDGRMATHGVIMHTAEDTYECHWHAPYINYLFSLKDYDAEIEDISNKRFLFQLQGPRCLEIVEQLTQDNLHDLEYRHFCMSSIDGHPVRILRFGMAGTLGYEIHGDFEYATELFKKLLVVGHPYGIRPIGAMTYCMNHIEGGFPQFGTHIISSMPEDPGFVAYIKEHPYNAVSYNTTLEGIEFMGSAGTGDPTKFQFNPYAIGLGGCVNFKHEFRGKAALQELKKTEDKNVVMLKWNPEDLAKLYVTQFDPDSEYYKPMDYPVDGTQSLFGFPGFSADYVYDENGKELGWSFGRIYSNYYRAMLSFASLSSDARQIGKEVYVLWGDPGMAQMKIRATVERFPYNTDLENKTMGVNDIPKLTK